MGHDHIIVVLADLFGQYIFKKLVIAVVYIQVYQGICVQGLDDRIENDLFVRAKLVKDEANIHFGDQVGIGNKVTLAFYTYDKVPVL